jgi:hypothetical protein
MWKSLTFGALLLGACASRTPVHYAGPVDVASSELVVVNPDVKTLADAAEPMFHVQGSYWLFHDGGWYRSASIHGSWEAVANPPVPVRQIDQPYAFTHYRKDHPADQTAVREAGSAPAQEPNPGRLHPKLTLMPE